MYFHDQATNMQRYNSSLSLFVGVQFYTNIIYVSYASHISNLKLMILTNSYVHTNCISPLYMNIYLLTRI